MFSTTTSAVLTRSSNIARPRGAFRLRVTPFLLEFSSRENHAASPRLSESAVRPCSPEGGSILTTSAPSHASICVALGPASYCVRSSTRIPSRAFAIEWPPIVEPIIEERPGFAGTLRTPGERGGPFRGPQFSAPRDRGGARVRRGTRGAPRLCRGAYRGAPRVRRGAPNAGGYAGHFVAPIFT